MFGSTHHRIFKPGWVRHLETLLPKVISKHCATSHYYSGGLVSITSVLPFIPGVDQFGKHYAIKQVYGRSILPVL
jgi:hypothetical protein